MARRTDGVVLLDVALGVKLYKPTAKYTKWRLTYRDPFTDDRKQPGYHSLADGREAFTEAVEYVEAGRRVAPTAAPRRRSSAPTVDELFDRMVVLWRKKRNSETYIEDRVGDSSAALLPASVT